MFFFKKIILLFTKYYFFPDRPSLIYVKPFARTPANQLGLALPQFINGLGEAKLISCFTGPTDPPKTESEIIILLFFTGPTDPPKIY